MIRLSRHVKDLTSPHPHVMKQHPQVGGSGGLRTHRIRAVGGGLWEVCIAPIFMLPLLSHASWELSGRWCAAWHSLMTMVIFTMHQTHNHRSGPLRMKLEGLGTARCRDGAWQEGKGWPSPPHGWRASSYGLSIMPLMVVKDKVLICNYPFL